MPTFSFSAAALCALGASAVMAVPVSMTGVKDDPVPSPNGNWCGDVVESLAVGKTVTPGRKYHLCVDNKKLRWNQRAMDNSTMSIFNGTDFFQLTADTTAPGGWTCKTKTSGPEQPSFMPYRMTTIDDGASLNATHTVDGIDNVEDFMNFRQGSPPNIPNEWMHWSVAPTVKSEPARALLRTDCVQRSGMDRKGPLQSGSRDFSKNYAYAFTEAEVPKGITCTQMAPHADDAIHSQNVEFFGPVSVFGQ